MHWGALREQREARGRQLLVVAWNRPRHVHPVGSGMCAHLKEEAHNRLQRGRGMQEGEREAGNASESPDNVGSGRRDQLQNRPKQRFYGNSQEEVGEQGGRAGGRVVGRGEDMSCF